MNHKIANMLKDKISTIVWTDKIAGLVQTANIRVKDKDSTTDKSYPISCDIDYYSCIKGAYQDLAPDSKKKSVLYFEDHGGTSYVERTGTKMKFQANLRLVAWLNLRLINEAVCDDDSGDCGVSGDYVIDIIRALPTVPFAEDDFVSIFISNISQVERSVDIFSRYTYNEQATQYLMYPYDYFALDLTIDITIPCLSNSNNPVIKSAVVENATPNIVTLTYTFNLDEVNPPDVAAYNLSGNTIVSLTVSGKNVILTCQNNYSHGSAILLDYDATGTDPLRGYNGFEVAYLTNYPVTNNV